MQKPGDILGTRKDKPILVPRNPRNQAQTDAIAEKLIAMFRSPGHRDFFLRAAWRLSEARLMTIAEYALKSGYDSPRAYFIKAVKNDKDYDERDQI